MHLFQTNGKVIPLSGFNLELVLYNGTETKSPLPDLSEICTLPDMRECS